MPSNVSPRGIFASFLAAVTRGDTKAWLAQIIEDRTPDGVVVPPNEAPIDHLLAIVGQHGDRASVEALGEAAGDLLADLLRGYRPPQTPSFLRTLARLLLVLQSAPASPRVWRTLFYGYQAGDFSGVSPDGLDIRHLALLAIATSPPVNALPLDLALAFFQRELTERPDFAPAAFAGLRQLAPFTAVQHVPDLLAALHVASPPVPPDQPLWELFVALEDAEPTITAPGISPAEELGRVLRAHPALVQLITRILDHELEAVEDFPSAWAAFQRGLASEPSRPQAEFVFTARALDSEVARHVQEAAGQLSGPLLSARPPARAA